MCTISFQILAGTRPRFLFNSILLTSLVFQKGLSEKVHEETIKRYLGEPLLEHVSRDAIAIPAK